MPPGKGRRKRRSPLVENQEAEPIGAGPSAPGMDGLDGAGVGPGEGAAHEGLPPGWAKMADLPPLTGLRDSEEEEKWSPCLERPAPQVNQRSEVNRYCRGRNLRDRPRIKFTEQDEPKKEEEEERKDDHYLYCEECESFFLEECELHGPPLFIPDTPVVLGGSDRARLTLPPGLEVRRSRIPGAGLGVFNCGKAVAKGTHYGPYEGEVMKMEEAMERDSWVIYKSRNCDEYIDVKRETHSNWMRYVNCARTEEEQNLVAFQYRGGILYRCCRLLAVGEELLVWYGQEYRYQSISFNYLWDQKSTARGVMSELSQTQVFSCSECPSFYTSQIYFHKHIKRSHDNLYITMLRNGEIRPETLSSSRSLPITTSNTPLTPAPTWRHEDTDKPRPGGKSFTREDNLRTHQHSDTREKLYHCDQCGKNFSHKSSVRTHQRVHTGEKPYHCDQCGKNFNQEFHLRTHQRVHTREKPYHCDQCGKNFSHKSSVRTHQRVHTGEKPYHCDQCGKNFNQEFHLRTHQRVHTGEKPFHCDQCGKNFTRACHLREHQRVHTGEKPFYCDQCGKNFTRACHLRRHQRVHTGEKPFYCDQCGKNFTSEGNLRTHQRVHTGEKPFYCDQCGKNFTQLITLKRHQSVHTREKLYHCDHCGKNFTTACHLREHQCVHTGEKPYHCDQCGKNFTSEGNLRTHQRIHTGEKPYHCDQCGKSFTQLITLKRHQSVHT